MSGSRRSGLLLAFAAFLVAQAFDGAGWLRGADQALMTTCYRVRGPRPAAPEVVIVGIDVPAIGAAGRLRRVSGAVLCTKLIRKLTEAKPAVIALDMPSLIVFGSPDQPEQSTDELVAELRKAGNVVLPCVLRPVSEPPAPANPPPPERFAIGSGELTTPIELRDGRLTAPPDALCEAAAGVGHLNIYPDADGVIRSIPLAASADGVLWPSLALETVRIYRALPPGSARLQERAALLGNAAFDVAEGAEMAINFAGGYKHFAHISLAEIARADGPAWRQRLAGKVLIVGPTAANQTRFWRTPAHPALPGAEITANAVANLLHESELKSPAWWASILLSLLAALVVGWAAPALGPVRGAMLGVVTLAVTFAISVIWFSLGVWLAPGVSLCAVIAATTVMVMHAAVTADRERSEAEARLESRMQTVSGVGSLIVSTSDRRQLLDQIVLWVERELDVPAVSILLMDESRRKLRFEVASGEKGPEVKSFTIELGHGIAGAVAASGIPMIVNDARNDPRQARDISDAVGFPTDSVVCVPMTLHGEVVGVVEALNKRSGPFTAGDEALLTVIAQEAALFLESAKLYSELQQRVDDATSDLRAANQDLTTQKAKIETLVSEMESGVIATDAQDQIVTWNRAAERLLGVPEARALGGPALAIIEHPGLSELFAMPLSPLGGRHADEVTLTAAGDEPLVIRASIMLIGEAEGGYGKLAILTDITQFIELDRMKTDLISFVSHELKNPLASISGFAQIIQRRAGDDAPEQNLLSMLGQQARRMEWLVEDFLDVSRIDAGRALEMRWSDTDDFVALIQPVIDLQAATADRHTFALEVADDAPAIRADREKVEQVLVNLINNAVKYSPRGGQVTVTVRREESSVMCSVTDEGIGIKPEDLPNLFQRFRRVAATRQRIPGTGIGLFLSRHLVEAHGGRIWAQSGEGGSTFSFTLPIEPPKEAPAKPDATTDSSEAG